MTDEVEPFVTVLPDEPAPVEFTPAQQEKLDEILKKAMGRAGKDARAETERLRIENERLKQVAAGKGSADELERVRGELASSRLEQQAILETSVRSQRDLVIAQESSKYGFIDTDTLQRLTRGNLRHNAATGSFEIISDEGTPVLNAAQEPISVTDFFADYASKKPWLQRGQVKGGGGGSSSSGSGRAPAVYDVAKLFGPGSNAQEINRISIQQPELYKKLRAEARARNLVV